jgi:hypothetical protein
MPRFFQHFSQPGKKGRLVGYNVVVERLADTSGKAQYKVAGQTFTLRKLSHYLQFTLQIPYPFNKNWID